jgi:hypothetical protein
MMQCSLLSERLKVFQAGETTEARHRDLMLAGSCVPSSDDTSLVGI